MCYYIGGIFDKRGIFCMQDEFIDADLLKIDFGRLFAHTRREHNLTQEKLSELTGISDVYLRKIECGKCSAAWTIWLSLCTALDVDIAEFRKNISFLRSEKRSRSLVRNTYTAGNEAFPRAPVR